MVSKSQKKLIKSLSQKKYRKQHGLFVAEGKKVINELLTHGLQLHSLFTIEQEQFEVHDNDLHVITNKDLAQISFLTTPQVALAIFYIPKSKEISSKGLILALDDVRDPGNLGTIIRLCDWYGVEDLVCSMQTVDCYNPKVIQATMGSITRVNITYCDLAKFIEDSPSSINVYGTFMNGDSIYNNKFSEPSIVVMGNEANGISDTIKALVTKQITIPQFGANHATESLNVASATAIVLNEFRRY